jgi:hypothetical protein
MLARALSSTIDLPEAGLRLALVFLASPQVLTS